MVNMQTLPLIVLERQSFIVHAVEGLREEVVGLCTILTVLTSDICISDI